MLGAYGTSADMYIVDTNTTLFIRHQSASGTKIGIAFLPYSIGHDMSRMVVKKLGHTNGILKYLATIVVAWYNAACLRIPNYFRSITNVR